MSGAIVEAWLFPNLPLDIEEIPEQVVIRETLMRKMVGASSFTFDSCRFECVAERAKIALDCGCRDNSANVLRGKGSLAKLFGEILKSLDDLLS